MRAIPLRSRSQSALSSPRPLQDPPPPRSRPCSEINGRELWQINGCILYGRFARAPYDVNTGTLTGPIETLMDGEDNNHQACESPARATAPVARGRLCPCGRPIKLDLVACNCACTCESGRIRDERPHAVLSSRVALTCDVVKRVDNVAALSSAESGDRTHKTSVPSASPRWLSVLLLSVTAA